MVTAGCGLLLLEAVSAAGVLRCEDAQGAVTYSDTDCVDETEPRQSVDESTLEPPPALPEPTADEGQRGEPEWTHERARRAYEQRRQSLIDQLVALDFHPRQPVLERVETKARHQLLVRQLEALDAHWVRYMDPQAAPRRSREQRLRGFERRFRRAERRLENARERVRVEFADQTYLCERTRGELSCR